MKRLPLRILLVFCAAWLMPVAAQALPAWLPGDTVVATAGPATSATSFTAAMIESASAGIQVNPDTGTVTFINGRLRVAGMWEWAWDQITLDPDPSVSFAGNFTNLDSSGPRDFIFSIATPVSPALPTSLYGGSTSVIIADAGGNGATLTNITGQAGYAGAIDGVAWTRSCC